MGARQRGSSGGIGVAAALAVVALGGGAARAQERLHREPPPFAFEACSGRSDGAACEVQLPDRRVEGTCRAYTDQRLFCRPAHPPGPPPGP
ncbi:MAG: hypothetical protein U0325_28835 [Polyangiales bacterium]